MATLNFKDRGAFWATVWREGIPCVRVSAKKVIFDAAALDAWLASRSNSGRVSA